MRFSGVSDEHVKSVQTNGESQSPEPTGDDSLVAHANGQASKANEIRILLPKDSSSDTVLDTVLAAWAILVERYQREVFSQFTWGIKDGGNDNTQCMVVLNLDWPNHMTAASLKTKIREQRRSNLSSDQGTIFLNDGSKEEVQASLWNYTNITDLL